MKRTICICLLAACGSDTTSRAPATLAGPPAGLDAPRASADDAIVATVDGHPVWASCVTDQLARRAAATRDAALHQCIDVELLARAADRRGLAADREVVTATRTALVSRLVAINFEDKYRTAADLPAAVVEPAFEKRKWMMHRPEVRGSGYVRVIVAPSEPVGSPVDLAARALADRIAAAAAPQTGMFTIDLSELAERLAAGSGQKLEHADVQPTTAAQMNDAPYTDALYAIPAIGQIYPTPARTPYGWDIVLWTSVLPPLETSRDQLLAQLFPDLRRLYFAQWVDGIRRTDGINVEHIDASLPLLDQLPVSSTGLP